MSGADTRSAEIFKALADPVRWHIIRMMACEDELACSVLETALPVSKPTISYHARVLTQAGLIEVRRRGRHCFYALHRDRLRAVMQEMSTLTRARQPGEGQEPVAVTAGRYRTEDRDEPSRAGRLVTW